MHLSNILIPALALVASAAPAGPKIHDTSRTDATDTYSRVSDYFNLLAARVQAAKVTGRVPVCDLSRAKMPAGSELLPAPEEGFKVRHVAVGRGTQNYTCSADDETAAPEPAGAVAVLFNASCVAALYPEILEAIPGVAIHFSLGDAADGIAQLGPASLPVSGVHYFSEKTTAFFDLNTENHQYGEVACKKQNATAAPAAAAIGQGGEKAVPWLLLNTVDGTTDNVQSVYRLTTAGGTAPATCKGQPEKFQVEYAAVYWFWQGESKEE